MDSIVSIINQIASIGGTVLPVLPYLFITALVYAVMSKLIKPWIRSHKLLGTDKFTSNGWLVADRCVVFYPIGLGALAGLVLSLMHVTVVVFYCMCAGFASQALFSALEHWAKPRGIALPSDFFSSSDSTPPSK